MKNNAIELEAFLAEGDISHLDTRHSFEYKQYRSLEGRQKAMKALLDADIEKVRSVRQSVLSPALLDAISDDDCRILEDLLAYLDEAMETIERIKDEYGSEEWDLFSDVNHPQYGRSLRLESQRNREKRLPLLKQSIEEEADLLWVIERHKEVEVISSRRDMEAMGVIKLQAKKIYHNDLYGQGIDQNDKWYQTKIAPYFQDVSADCIQKIQKEYVSNRHVLDQLLADEWIQELAPQMFIDWVARDTV